jgi:transposase
MAARPSTSSPTSAAGSIYTLPWARRRLREWIAWTARSRLDPFRKVGRTIKRCFEGVLAYFETGYTTSRAEGLNTKARLARQAFGFHSADAVRAMIELRCTGLNIGELHLCGVVLSKAREGIGST